MTPAKLKFGPADHGRPVTAQELEEAEYFEGFKYEIIDGRFYVSPVPNLPEHALERWLRRKLERFADDHPAVLNWVANKARVFVPDRPELTVPEPDLAGYRDYPTDEEIGEVSWEDISPLIVAEVLVANAPDKGMVRNVELYHQVPSISEYWVLDGQASAARPQLIVHRRWGKGWRVHTYAYGATFTTRTLPGFELLIDPRR
jgi:Uma2 family endonuclease